MCSRVCVSGGVGFPFGFCAPVLEAEARSRAEGLGAAERRPEEPPESRTASFTDTCRAPGRRQSRSWVPERHAGRPPSPVLAGLGAGVPSWAPGGSGKGVEPVGSRPGTLGARRQPGPGPSSCRASGLWARVPSASPQWLCSGSRVLVSSSLCGCAGFCAPSS